MSQLLLSFASSGLFGCGCRTLGPRVMSAALPAASVRHRSPLKKVRKRGPFLDWTKPEPDPRILSKHIPATDERWSKAVRPPRKYDTFSVHYDPLVDELAGHFVKNGTRDKLRDVFTQMMTEIKHIQFKKRKTASEEDKATIEIDPVRIIHKAVENVTPLLIIKNVFRAGFLYKVPCPMRESESRMRACIFIKKASCVRSTSEHLYRSLSRELVNASNNEGKAVHTKLTMHKECEENRAYANYRIT